MKFRLFSEFGWNEGDLEKVSARTLHELATVFKAVDARREMRIE